MENKFGFGIIGMFPNHNPTRSVRGDIKQLPVILEYFSCFLFQLWCKFAIPFTVRLIMLFLVLIEKHVYKYKQI